MNLYTLVNKNTILQFFFEYFPWEQQNLRGRELLEVNSVWKQLNIRIKIYYKFWKYHAAVTAYKQWSKTSQSNNTTVILLSDLANYNRISSTAAFTVSRIIEVTENSTKILDLAYPTKCRSKPLILITSCAIATVSHCLLFRPATCELPNHNE